MNPYHFTATDARKTLVHALELLDATPSHAHDALAQRRAAIAEALDSGLDDNDTLEIVWPLLCDMRSDLAVAGLLPPRQEGRVVHLAAGRGGVPKPSIDSCSIDWKGVQGDRQASREHHGRPWQAVCLWSAETLNMLNDEGHPVTPGGVGENVLLADLDWSDVWPGVRLTVGSAELEVMAYAVPCKQIAFNFVVGDFRRIAAERGPVARVYTRVIAPGVVSVGDVATLEP